jgi:hypothetical protein
MQKIVQSFQANQEASKKELRQGNGETIEQRRHFKAARA